MENSWDYLEQYKGSLIQGEWPTIPEMFTLSLTLHADRRCFTSFDPREMVLTYQEAWMQIKAAAERLLFLGLKPGERVLLTGKNSPEWAVAYLGILFAGGVVVPVDYQLTSEKIEGLRVFTESRFLFVDREKFNELGKDESLPLVEKVALDDRDENYIFNLAGTLSGKDIPEMPRVQEEDLAAILFTSGTTGNEKGVMLTHKNFSTDVFQACHPMFMTASEKDVWYALLPIHHSYTMTAVFLESVKHGSELVFAKRMAVGQIVKDLQKGKVTMFMAIPLIYNKIIKGMMKKVKAAGFLPNLYVGMMMRISGFLKRTFKINIGKKVFRFLLEKAGLSRLRILICGGGPLAPETFRRYNELGLDFVQGYGLTETAPIITLNPLHRFKLQSVGRVFPLVEMKILDPDERGIGEIAVKGPNITQGYYKNEEATQELFNDEGYLLTGDVGYLDKENYLFLTGRRKSLIVTEGGKNVFPEEIEDHFQLFQEVEQILIKGYITDKATQGEGIEAVFYPSPEFFQDEDEGKIQKALHRVVKEVNQELLVYQKITRIRILKEPMEMTTTRKIKRNLVIENLDREDQGGKVSLIQKVLNR